MAQALVVLLLSEEGAAAPLPHARYSQAALQQVLQVAGCKPKPAAKTAERTFRILQQRALLPPGQRLSLAARLRPRGTPAAPPPPVSAARSGGDRPQAGLSGGGTVPLPSVAVPLGPPASHLVEVGLLRDEFEQLVASCLAAVDANSDLLVPPDAEAAAGAGGAAAAAAPACAAPAAAAGADSADGGGAAPPPTSRGVASGCGGSGRAARLPALLPDFRTSCGLRERSTSVTILLCGTSGTGKSTLASLLASRLGITTVVSTDSIRHMLRSFASEEEDPLLWASTYQAGSLVGRLDLAPGGCAADPRKAAIRGYKAQSERVVGHLRHLIAACEARRQSLVVEGVHLSLSLVGELMGAHPSIVPFLIHISNEARLAKHLERFAVRAKAMTLREDGNRYVRHLRPIRAIQDYLCRSADKRGVPKVDNTNVDRSIATIHATVLGCLRRRAQGEALFDPASGMCKPVLEEYLRCKSATWSSRDMLELIRRKSAAGEAASPDGPSTSAASSTTPRAPASEPGDWPLFGGAGAGGLAPLAAAAAAGRPGSSSFAVAAAAAASAHERADEGQSFYGTEASSRGEDEDEEEQSEEGQEGQELAARAKDGGPPCRERRRRRPARGGRWAAAAGGGRRGQGGGGGGREEEGVGGGGTSDDASTSGDSSDAGSTSYFSQHSEGWGHGGTPGSSAARRRHSEVGSVLSPEEGGSEREDEDEDEDEGRGEEGLPGEGGRPLSAVAEEAGDWLGG
eukprot:scaffold12.g8070.t1